MAAVTSAPAAFGQVEEVSPRVIRAAYPVLPSCSSFSMIVASTRGSSATPYRMSPERTSVNHGPCEVLRVIRFPLLTTVPDHVPALARLFVPAFDRL